MDKCGINNRFMSNPSFNSMLQCNARLLWEACSQVSQGLLPLNPPYLTKYVAAPMSLGCKMLSQSARRRLPVTSGSLIHLKQ